MTEFSFLCELSQKVLCTCTQMTDVQKCAHREFGLFSEVTHIPGLEDQAKAQNTFSIQAKKKIKTDTRNHCMCNIQYNTLKVEVCLFSIV